MARVMGPEIKKRSSQYWDERFVRGATQFRQPFKQKTRWCATGKRPASLITQVRQSWTAYTIHLDNGGVSV